MSEENKNEQYPKFVKVDGFVDEFKNLIKEIYIALYLKEHERYNTEQIFALAHNAADGFLKHYQELNTRVNINFEKEIEEIAGPEVAKEITKKRTR